MKCKKCGGELIIQKGICFCASCGTSSTLDSIYENVDVCICYEENDVAGRRTRDSIVAQEVYRKLEENKIATFCERISADGMSGDDLEASRLAAINRAKIIIVLGTTIGNFETVEKKYSDFFAGKPVIPFCVDVNPSSIPKTLSKIQAMSYSTIGWDRDMVKGICNILGRRVEVETGSLYGRRKAIIAAICAIAAAIAIVVAVLCIGGFGDKNQQPDNDTQLSEQTGETTKSLTQREIYEQADAFYNENKYAQALNLFAQIPEHPDSANKMKLIYAKYEGYYQKDDFNLHLDIVDSLRADIEISILSESKVVKVNESAALGKGNIAVSYIDNHSNVGNIEIVLADDGLTLKMTPTNGKDKYEFFFSLLEKSDVTIEHITADMLNKWLKEQLVYDDFLTMGYELYPIYDPYERADFTILYGIKGYDVYLSFRNYIPISETDEKELEQKTLVAAVASADVIAPSLIGKNSTPVSDDYAVYWPHGFLSSDLWFAFRALELVLDYENTDVVTRDTLVGVALKENFSEYAWGVLIEDSKFSEELSW